VPAEAEIVRRVYDLRTDGLSYQRVAAALNRAGAYGRGGGKWTATGVQRLVNGRYYLGYFKFRGEWIKGQHPAIISEETWRRAQALAEAGKQNWLATARPGRRPSRHLFTGGMLRCQICHGPMIPRSDGEDRYVCASNRAEAGSCFMPSFSRWEVDLSFLNLFEEKFLDLNATREHVAAQLDQDLQDTVGQSHVAEREVASIERKRARIEEDYLAETLSAPAYERMSAKLDEQATAAVAERDRLEAHAESIRSSRLNMDAESETLRRLAGLRNAVAAKVRDADQEGDIETLRAVIAAAFKSVVLHYQGGIAGMVPGVGFKLPHALPIPFTQTSQTAACRPCPARSG
jgi:site-specific DNA recombinase